MARARPLPVLPLGLTLALGIGCAGVVLAVLAALSADTTPDALPWPDPEWIPGRTPGLQLIPEVQAEGLRALSMVLLALGGLAVAAALVNLLTLLIGRGLARRGDLAMRAVLGASPGRLLRQLTGEIVPLLLAGAGAGAILTLAGATVALQTWPAGPLHAGRDALPGTAAAAALLLLTALAAWLLQAEVARRRRLRPLVDRVGRRSTAGPLEALGRDALGAAITAAAVVVVGSAGLLLRGFTVDPVASGIGAHADDLITLRLEMPGEPAASAAGQEAIRQGVRALPGVVDSSVVTPGTLLGLGPIDRVRSSCSDCGRGTMALPSVRLPARLHAIGPGFTATLGATLLRGRDLAAGDDAAAPPVVLISRTAAAHLFPGGEPIGKGLQVGGEGGPWHTVVGVVEDIRMPGIGSSGESVPAIYLSSLQHPPGSLELVVQGSGAAAPSPGALARVVRDAAPGIRVVAGGSLAAAAGAQRAPLLWFGGLFAGLAGEVLLLAGLGLAAVMKENVGRRRREMGIRQAVGATGGRVLRQVVGEGVRVALLGGVVGAIALGGVARLLQLRFHGVHAWDPALYLSLALALASIGAMAAWVPARAAARLEPQVALAAD